MPSTFTPRNRLTMQEIGSNESTWGDILNEVIDLTDEALDGILDIDITLGNKTLTVIDGSDDEARNRMVRIVNAHTADRQVILPDNQKIYFVSVVNSNGATTTIRNASDLTGVTITGTSDVFIICDGTVTELFNPTPQLGEMAYLSKVEALQLVYPIGSLYVNYSNANNPNDAGVLGFGTWQAFGEGRVLIGVGSATDTRSEVRAFAAAEQSGEFRHALTEAENGPHLHPVNYSMFLSDTREGPNGVSSIGSGGSSGNTTSSGSGTAHNNVQPYVTVYMWRRVS